MGLWKRLQASQLLRHTSLAVVDQGLNSAANFAVGLLLIRSVSTAEYGLFVLANTALYLAIGIENAWITAPMSVRAPKLAEADKRAFIASLGLGHFLLWPLGLLAAAMAIGVAGSFQRIEAATCTLMLVTIIVSLPFVGREFLRQTLFIVGAPASVLLADIAYAVVLVVAISLARTTASPGLGAIASVGVASLASVAVAGFFYARQVGLPARLDWQPLRQIRLLAGWGFLGMLVSWAQNQGFLYLLAAVQGSEPVGNVSAARLLLVPIGLVITGVATILRPRMAAWLAQGEGRQAATRLLTMTLATALFAGFYVTLLWLTRLSIVEPLLRKPVSGIEELLLVWAGVFIVQIFRENFMILLQALERFEILFVFALVGGIAALSTGYGLLPIWGAAGTVAGIAIGEAVYLAGIVLALWRSPELWRKQPS